MNRKISWDSALLQEIELVYEKAEADDTAGKMLEQLEDKALSECRAICAAGAIKNVSGEAVTPRQFEDSPDEEKEELICQLARLGLAGLDTDIASATITVRLSSLIQRTMACTFFDLMNRLENLDGSLNVLIPKWTLELQAPLGGKKGLMQWELMIMTFYPWLSVREVSTNEEAVPPYPDASTQGSAPAVKSTPKQESAQPEPVKAPEKKSFWKRLFG